MMDKHEQEARERLSITAEDIKKYPALFNDRTVYFELAVSKMAQALRERDDDADAEIAKLRRGEYICRKCGLRKDGEFEPGDF